MPEFLARPVRVQAIQFTGKNGGAVRDWVNERADFSHDESMKNLQPGEATWFITKGMTAAFDKQAWHYVRDGANWPDKVRGTVYNYLSGVGLPVHDMEYVVMDSRGGFYPCHPAIFLERYKPI